MLLPLETSLIPLTRSPAPGCHGNAQKWGRKQFNEGAGTWEGLQGGGKFLGPVLSNHPALLMREKKERGKKG